MKRFLSAALALSLLGATAASAQPYNGNRGGQSDYGHSSNNNGALFAGVGILALAAIFAASQSHDRDYGYQNHYPRQNWNDHRAYRGNDRRDDDRGYGR